MFYFNFNPKGYFYINQPQSNPGGKFSAARGGNLQQPPHEEKICPNCGLTTKELYTKGKIGCNQCVETFRLELETIILHIQGRNKFSGRVPKALSKENTFNLEETQEKLKLAIEEERYEDAAVYRDLIRNQGGQS